MKLVFATNNKNKLQEIQSLAGNKFEILSLDQIQCFDEIPETCTTLEGNANQKAMYIYNKYKLNCFADDTGLEIDALDGEPGVYSARYAGLNCNADDNIDKVLEKMKECNMRNAKFRTIISLIIDGKEIQFEGEVKGKILHERHGEKGFGYDPIFQPIGYNHSFAELSVDEKNKISHRGLATQKLIEYLKNI
jgi:XTP/dITP diphosphohydrolase